MNFSMVSATMALLFIAMFGLSSGYWIKIQNEVDGCLYLVCTVRRDGAKDPEIIHRRKELPHAMHRFFAEMDQAYECGMCWRSGDGGFRYGRLQVYINSSLAARKQGPVPIQHRWEARRYGFVHLPDDGSYDRWGTSKTLPMEYWCKG